jgi:hypothetical protein
VSWGHIVDLLLTHCVNAMDYKSGFRPLVSARFRYSAQTQAIGEAAPGKSEALPQATAWDFRSVALAETSRKMLQRAAASSAEPDVILYAQKPMFDQ